MKVYNLINNVHGVYKLKKTVCLTVNIWTRWQIRAIWWLFVRDVVFPETANEFSCRPISGDYTDLLHYKPGVSGEKVANKLRHLNTLRFGGFWHSHQPQTAVSASCKIYIQKVDGYKIWFTEGKIIFDSRKCWISNWVNYSTDLISQITSDLISYSFYIPIRFTFV